LRFAAVVGVMAVRMLVMIRRVKVRAVILPMWAVIEETVTL
jgi:hypothetical protein